MNRLAELNELKHLPPAEFDKELAKRLKEMMPKPKAAEEPKVKPPAKSKK